MPVEIVVNHLLIKVRDTAGMHKTPPIRVVTRALHALRRYGVAPDQIDGAILCAINATLCLRSGGDDRVAEGFNSDIALNGRAFHGATGCGGLGARPAPLATI